MLRVLVVSPTDDLSEFARTVLGRAGVECVTAPDAESGFRLACECQPRLVVVALGDRAVCEALVRRLRQDSGTRRMGLVAVLPAPLPPDEEALRQAGANAVLAGRPDPFRWDQTLERLLEVPSRRSVRLPVRFWTWFHIGDEAPCEGRVLDIGENGMLLESPVEMELATRLEAQLTLPDGQELVLIGELVRAAGHGEKGPLYGVCFRNPSPQTQRQLAAIVRSDGH